MVIQLHNNIGTMHNMIVSVSGGPNEKKTHNIPYYRMFTRELG
jgi:hypothetical protein